jgi:hypothetical protein
MGAMSMAIRALTLTAALGLLVTGCATRFQSRINTYLSHDLPFPSTEQNVRVAVVAEADPDEPLLEREVTRKVEHLLRERGYAVGSLEETDYVLLASFAIDSGNTVSGTYDVSVPGETVRTHYYTRRGWRGTRITRLHWRREQRFYSYTIFTCFLGMTLYDHPRYLAADQEHRDQAIVWQSTTMSSGSSSDLRSVIDYLLVATFEYFGQDTGKQVREALSEGSRRVKALREAVRAGVQDTAEN